MTVDQSVTIPSKQVAVQLVGPDELQLTDDKPVVPPGPHQLLARVQAVGLCFSDLKLLKQFSDHPRKGQILEGIAPDALQGLASYVPDEAPTVPGHEVVAEIVAVGQYVEKHRVGERVMVQADFRQLKTAGSNGAFGYNIEGGLQEYILLDERIVVEPGSGQRFLIPVDDSLSASAVALVEPWACVENSYATPERQTAKAGGRMLVVAEAGREIKGLADCFSPDGAPAAVTVVCVSDEQVDAASGLGVDLDIIQDEGGPVGPIGELDDGEFDDIIVYGSTPDVLEAVNDKLAAEGVCNVVTGGAAIGRKVSVGVGRLHYGRTRWVGTTQDTPADGYAMIPGDGELADGDAAVVVGAGGPMGQMHTIRLICSGKKDLRIVATDLDNERLASLMSKAAPLAEQRGVTLETVNTQTQPLTGEFTYVALMAPVGALVQQAIEHAAPGCRVNIFAGIPAPTRHELDLDRLIDRRCFLFGTSGSRIEDMQTVLDKVTSGQLDTNTSVDAVSGMAGAVDGIRAVEGREMAGKILVYPQLRELPLTPLARLAEAYPSVGEKLTDGMWTADAEAELLRVAK